MYSKYLQAIEPYFAEALAGDQKAAENMQRAEDSFYQKYRPDIWEIVKRNT